MKIPWQRWFRKTHYWGALLCALPVLVMIGSGLLLLLKKDVAWIQPPTRSGSVDVPTIGFDRMLDIARTVPEAGIHSWADVDRVDVRPGKGNIKIQSLNHWEIQIDHQSGDVLHVAFRRSGIIESIHDGTFFHPMAKLWVFLPSSVVLLVLWITGIFLFVVPLRAKWRRKNRSNPV